MGAGFSPLRPHCFATRQVGFSRPPRPNSRFRGPSSFAPLGGRRRHCWFFGDIPHAPPPLFRANFAPFSRHRLRRHFAARARATFFAAAQGFAFRAKLFAPCRFFAVSRALPRRRLRATVFRAPSPAFIVAAQSPSASGSAASRARHFVAPPSFSLAARATFAAPPLSRRRALRANPVFFFCVLFFSQPMFLLFCFVFFFCCFFCLFFAFSFFFFLTSTVSGFFCVFFFRFCCTVIFFRLFFLVFAFPFFFLKSKNSPLKL